MWIYGFLQVVCLLGVLSAKKRDDGFIRYETAKRETERRRVFKTQTSTPIQCAAQCSVGSYCDYFLYNTKQGICKLHQSKRNEFPHEIGELISLYWKVQCGKPPRASHGRYTVKDKVAHYQCNDNFKLYGNNDIKCSTSWPKGPKCLRHYWINPFQRGHIFHAKIPWGFRNNGSFSLSGQPKQKRCSFVILVGMKKESKSNPPNANFLFRLEVKISQTNQKLIIHTGSMQNEENIWKPNETLYYFDKTTILEVQMNKNDFKVHISNKTFPGLTVFPAMINYKEVKVISIFDDFKIESLKVDTA